MFTIACTRFNNATLLENQTYRQITKCEGCIYGTPNPITDSIPLNTNVVICEMNNSCDKIMGFGLIKNYLYVNEYYKIYKKGNYNRYTYKSKYRIDRNDLIQEEEKILIELEKIVFKGKGHLKRGFGITKIPEKKINNLTYDIKKQVHQLFLTRFHSLN